MEQLATVKRQHHLDPLTEWYVLAWDAFKAPRFPVDEALKLARVVGLDFDREVKNQVCEVKSSDLILWDSLTRKRKNKLGPVGGAVALDTLHQAAALGRDQNTGAAQAALEHANLLADATMMTALETLLNVLPHSSLAPRGNAEEGRLVRGRQRLRGPGETPPPGVCRKRTGTSHPAPARSPARRNAGGARFRSDGRVGL